VLRNSKAEGDREKNRRDSRCRKASSRLADCGIINRCGSRYVPTIELRQWETP